MNALPVATQTESHEKAVSGRVSRPAKNARTQELANFLKSVLKNFTPGLQIGQGNPLISRMRLLHRTGSERHRRRPGGGKEGCIAEPRRADARRTAGFQQADKPVGGVGLERIQNPRLELNSGELFRQGIKQRRKILTGIVLISIFASQRSGTMLILLPP